MSLANSESYFCSLCQFCILGNLDLNFSGVVTLQGQWVIPVAIKDDAGLVAIGAFSQLHVLQRLDAPLYIRPLFIAALRVVLCRWLVYHCFGTHNNLYGYHWLDRRWRFYCIWLEVLLTLAQHLPILERLQGRLAVTKLRWRGCIQVNRVIDFVYLITPSSSFGQLAILDAALWVVIIYVLYEEHILSLWRCNVKRGGCLILLVFLLVIGRGRRIIERYR